MNIALGFGSTEQNFEISEEKAIRDYVAERFAASDDSYFSDAFVNEIRAWLNDRANELHEAAARYRGAPEFPDRYSRYWPSVVADASHIVIILSVHHVNRRHALSPDGWALLQRKPIFLIEALELERAA